MKDTNEINFIVEERVIPNKSPYIIYQEHINRYSFALNFVKNKTVLDVACGNGYGSNYLAKEAKEVVGIDISNDAVNYAKNNYRKNNLKFLYGNAINLPFHSESFDVIVSFETIEHLENYKKYLAECRRVLKKGGIFICSTPNKEVSSPNSDKPLNPFHIKEFYIEEFYKLLNRYFKNIDLYGQHNINLTKRKIKKIIIEIISLIPFGEVVKNIVKKIINQMGNFSKSNNLVSGEIIDKNYEVLKFINNKRVRPGYIIAVAKNKKR